MNARQIKFLPRLSIRPIRHNDEQALPNAREIDAYAANGHVVTRRIFSDAEIALAIKAADEIYAGRRDVRLWSDKSRSYLDWKPGSPDHIRINDFIALQSEKIRRLLENPLLGATAARLANTRTVRLFNSSLIYKPPYGIRKSGDERVGWHTDHAYWPTCTSTNMLTVWIPMQDANEANGGLRFINGSHRWEDREDLRLLRSEKNFICDDHHKLNSRLANLGFETSEVCPSVPAGHMSVHHCLTLHSSGINLSNKPRIALAIHLQDEDNTYQRHLVDGRPFVYSHDYLCRTLDGHPDYTDPDVCPVLWSNMESTD